MENMIFHIFLSFAPKVKRFFEISTLLISKKNGVNLWINLTYLYIYIYYSNIINTLTIHWGKNFAISRKSIYLKEDHAILGHYFLKSRKFALILNKFRVEKPVFLKWFNFKLNLGKSNHLTKVYIFLFQV